MFSNVSNETVDSIVEELVTIMEVGSLNSRSKIKAIADEAYQIYRDQGLNPRKSLVYLTANKAKLAFNARMSEVKGFI